MPTWDFESQKYKKSTNKILSIFINIIDTNKQGLNGATVTIGDLTIPNSESKILIKNYPKKETTITVEKEGYKSISKEIENNILCQGHKFILEQENSNKNSKVESWPNEAKPPILSIKAIFTGETIPTTIFNGIGENVIIDWGDGNKNNISELTNPTYIYEDNLEEHEIKIYNVENLKSGNFSYIKNLKSVNIIDENITNISVNCFIGCTGLLEVILSDSVTTISDYCFYNCTSLSEIILPDSVTTIGGACFASCTSLSEVILPDSVTTIGTACFNNCTSLSEIILPDSVTIIDTACFNNCTSLSEIILPDSVTTIGNYCFENCINLSNIILSNSVTAISDYCFCNCTSLSEIILPDSITTIGYSCFYNCTSLSEIILPDSVTTIGGNCFNNCTSLSEIILPDSVTTIGDGCFIGCTGLSEIILPDSVTTIDDYCFAGCINLSNIILSNSLITLPNYWFTNCPITEINIPISVKNILEWGLGTQSSAFLTIKFNWTSQEDIIHYDKRGEGTEWGRRINDRRVKIIIPYGTKQLYINKGYIENMLQEAEEEL